MTEFETDVSITTTLEQSSLSDARAELESELSADPITVGVSGGGSRGGGRAATRLDSISSALDEGLDLDRTRNDLLRDLVDETEKGNFTRASRPGGGGLIGSVLGGGILGGFIISKLAGELGDFEWPDLPDVPDIDVDVPPIPPVETTEPDWVPVGVETPDWVPVNIPEPEWLPITIEFPTSSPTELPTDSVTRTRPNPLEEPEPSPFGDVPDYGSVTRDRPSPLEEPSSGDKDIPWWAIGAGAGAAGGAAWKLSKGSSPPPSPGAAASTPFSILPQIIAGNANKDTPLGRLLPDLPQRNRTRRAFRASNPPMASSTRSISARERRDTRRTNVTVDSTVNVEGVSERDVDKAMERAKRQAKEDLRRELIKGGQVGL